MAKSGLWASVRAATTVPCTSTDVQNTLALTTGDYLFSCTKTALRTKLDVLYGPGTNVVFDGQNNLILSLEDDDRNQKQMTITGGTVTFKNMAFSVLLPIQVTGGTLNFENVGFFSQKQQGSPAAAISISGGTVNMNQGLFQNNDGNYVIQVTGGVLDMKRVLAVNQASHPYSIMNVVAPGAVTLDFCTFDAGAMDAIFTTSNSLVTFSNSIMSSLSGPGSAVYKSLGSNIIGQINTTMLGAQGLPDKIVGRGNLGLGTLYFDRSTYYTTYYTLSSTSPAVNYIPLSTTPVFPDYPGGTAIIGGAADAGATESTFVPAVAGDSGGQWRENDGTRLVTVYRTLPTQSSATVNWVVVNGTAKQGIDFTFDGSSTYTWAPGNTGNTSISFIVQNPDYIQKPSRSFSIQFTSNDVAPSNLTIVINDDDQACPVNTHPGTKFCECNDGYTGIVGTQGSYYGYICTDINECTGTNNCDPNAACTNTPGGYTCACKSGYTGNGQSCSDVNECDGQHQTLCDSHATCHNTIGNYTCSCNPGYTGTGYSCNDVNECDGQNQTLCDSHATCHNTIGSYTCSCNPGFTGTGYSCNDINECDGQHQILCDSHAACQNTIGNYTCACNPGYTGTGYSCTDINECDGQHQTLCDSHATCNNTVGNYTCSCNPGYSGTGYACNDINECDGQHQTSCDSHATCQNTIGNYTCSCKPGYTGDGYSCDDVNECDGHHTINCSSNADCNNLPGTYSCTCKSGYSGNGTTCTAIDLCGFENNCDENATCHATGPGTYTCTCNSGFTGNGTTCTDLDECAKHQDNCDTNAKCTNTIGSFTCTCNSGYEGNGLICTDYDECAHNASDCSSFATCNNTLGSYTCSCWRGYTGDGRNCTDINECAPGKNSCDQHAMCTNLPGNYSCNCSTGFTGDGFKCEDINECAVNSTCAKGLNCINTLGSFECSVCPSGFYGNDTACYDINECNGTFPNSCSLQGSTCTNTNGSYYCNCSAGYQGNGTVCTDINECAQGLCSANGSTCHNTNGSYYCNCSAGFVGNGSHCVEIGVNCTGNSSCACGEGYTRINGLCSDLDECANVTTNNCSSFATCNNTLGSYGCSCVENYEGDGFACAPVVLALGAPNKKNHHTGAIVGGVLGGLAGLAMIAGLVFLLMKKNKRRESVPSFETTVSGGKKGKRFGHESFGSGYSTRNLEDNVSGADSHL